MIDVNTQKFSLGKFLTGFIILCVVMIVVAMTTSGLNKETDDEKRKNDIVEIARAIGAYKSSGAIPASYGGWCDLKQDGTGCPGFPGLISQYIRAIPRDPKGGYYKYYSDGRNFNLMAILADEVSSYTYSSFSSSYSLQGRNFLTINQSNGSEKGVINGFEPYGETVLASNDAAYSGSYSVRVDISANNSGVVIDAPIGDIPKGQTVSIQAMVWIPAGKVVSFGIRGDNGSGLREIDAVKIDGNGSWQVAKLSYTLTEKWNKVGIIVYSANYNINSNFYFFVDDLKLEYKKEPTAWVLGI
ncbi:MAG: carbohydrate binding domain-containing protein [Candidatus Paceibacterota bacterium]